MDFFIERLADGLTRGCIYSLAAIAFSLFYGVTRGFSFAPGGICLIGALVSAFIVFSFAPLGPVFTPAAFVAAFAAAIAFGGAAGWILNRGLEILPARSGTLPLIASAGVLIAAVGLLELVQQNHLPIRMSAVPPLMLAIPALLTVRIAAMQPVIVALGAVAIGALAWIICKTKFGLRQRAVVQDARMAELLGIDAARTRSISILIACIVAAVAGWMLCADQGVPGSDTGLLTVIFALLAAMLGGLDSLKHSAIAGFVVGIGQVFWSAYFSPSYAALSVFAAVLFLVRFFPRPSGHRSVPEEI